MQNNNLLMKRFLPATLLVLLLGVAGMTKSYAFDFSAVCSTGQTLYYNITDATYHIVTLTYPGTSTSSPWPTSYDKPTGNVVLPNSVVYEGTTYVVKHIGQYAFYGCSEMTEINIPTGITTIGARAFWVCPLLQTVHFNATNCTQMYTTTGLSSNYVYHSVFNSSASTSGNYTPIVTLTIGDNVTRIPDYAFKNSSNLTSAIIVPNSVTYIGKYAFCGTLSQELIVGDSVANIGAYAFYNCSDLSEVTIGEGVTSIGEYAFWGCPQLQTLHFNATNCTQMYTNSSYHYSVFNGTTTNGGTSPIVTLTIGDNVTAIPDYAFRNNPNLVGSIVIPDSVTTIGSYAFNSCSNLSEVTIGEGVTFIGEYAFWNCPMLQTVHFNAVNCTQMYTRTGSSSSNWVYYSVFSYNNNSGHSAITTLTIGENVTKIPNYAFMGSSNLTSLIIPNSVARIGSYAFYYCNILSEVTIGEGVTYIGGYAFWKCPNLQTVHFNAINCTNMYTQTGTSSSNYVYYSVFNGTDTNGDALPIDSLTIGSNVTRIPDYAFRNCFNLTANELVIPNSVSYIGTYAFYGYSNLSELTIGEGVTTVDDYAFWNCPNLQTLHFNATNCSTMGTTGSYTIFNSGTTNSTSPALTTLTIGDNVTQIPANAFRNCTGITCTLSIPESMISIGDYSFYSCTGLMGSLVFGNSLTSIGTYAFYNCTGFMGPLTLGDSLVSVGDWAFYNCTGFTGSLVFGNSLISIGNSAFANCTGFTGSLTFGNSLTSIGNSAFANCTGFTGSLTFGDSLTTIGYSAFNSCTGITGSLTIPNSVTTIENYAFRGCGFTGSVTIGNSVTSIGQYAFNGCTNMTEVTIGEGVTSIGYYAFWNCPNLQTLHFNATNCTTMNTRTGTTSSNYVYYSVFNSNENNGGPIPIVTLTIGENVTRIPDYAFRNCTNLSSIITIPNATTYIGTYAFYGSHSSELSIGEGVTSIGGYAFWYCPNLQTVHYNATSCNTMYTRTGTSSSNYVYYSVFSNSAPAITTLTIGDNVTRIPNYAFQNCSNITSALDLSECTYIGTNAFYGTAISQAVLGDSLTTIGASAFYGCSNLTALTIGENVTTIGEQAFWHCANLQTVYFNATNCTTMYTRTGTSTSNYQYYSVFTSGNNGYASAITRVVIGSNVQRIPDYAFKYSEDIYQRLVIPASVTYIGKEAFYDCSSIPQMVIQGNSLTSLGNAAFYGCSSIRNSLNLPNSLTAINQEAFSGCSNIPSLHFGNAVTSIGASAFLNCSSIAGVLTLPNTLISIGASAFSGCSSLSNALIIPNSVTSIGASAFYNCTNLTELTIGESVTSIGYYAFWGCPNLHYLYFNATNCTTMQTKIGAAYYSVFSSSTEEAEAEVPLYVVSFMDNVSRIPDYAFKNCPNMYGVVIPNSATYIGSYAFYNCGGYYLDLGDSLTTIGSYAFALSSNFEGDLIIPNTVTSLGAYAFYSCMGFDGSLIIGSGIQTIGQSTFNMCNNFSGALIIGRQVNSIGANAFNGCSGFSALISENPAPPTSYASSFTSMDFNMPVYVPYGTVVNYQTATGWNLFSNYMEQCVFDQLNNDHWSDAENWYAFELPGNNDVVCINSDCHLDIDAEVLHLYVYNTNNAITIDNGKTLSATYGIGTMQPSQLVIADGGQLVNNMGNTYGTVQKQINGYGTGNEGWYTIATPIYNGSPTSAITNDAYDLYSYDEPTHYWMNEKVATNNMTMLNSAQGYLYANQEDQTLEFVGELNASNKEVFIDLSRQNTELPGYNLVGNPFTNNVNVSDILLDGEPLSMYYKAIGGGNLVAFTDQDNEPIRPCEGFIVQTLNTYGYLSINDPWRGESNNGYVRLLLSMKDDSNLWIQTDRAYLRTNVGQPLKKATTMEKQGLLYFIDNGGGYAVATNHTNSDFMLLAFEPAMNGTYQIDASLLNANCGYLHLIDRISGDDIDLLKTPTYVFEGNTMDVRLRFALALSPEAIPDWNDVVLRDSPFVMPFHNQNNDQDATGNSVIYYTINALANPIEGGLVIGTGYFMEGETCNLTATANEGYSFTNWMKGDEIVSTEATYSFTVTEDASFVANFTESGVTQTTNLAQGWSWWSTYIEMNGNNGLQQLEQSLGHNGLMIKTQSPYVQNYYPSLGYDYWFGPLTNVGLTNEAGYQISLSNACQAVVSGAVADAATHPVTIAPSWNWIGYPVMTQQSLSTALANFTPAANDLIKGQNSSATYYANYGWFPTSFTLRPGQGYMYLSNATENKTLTYAVGRGDNELVKAPERIWTNDEHAFVGNLTVMAVVAIDGEEQRSEELELGAFVGGECRGSAVLVYFEPTDRWYAILTIAGEEGEEINFAVINRRKANINARSINRVVFVDNAVVGNLDQPYEVDFATEDALRIYPNPVERNEAFMLDIPSNETVAEMFVCNVLGDVVLHKEGKQDGQQISGVAVSGVYTVKVVCKSGNVYVGRLIVK